MPFPLAARTDAHAAMIRFLSKIATITLSGLLSTAALADGPLTLDEAQQLAITRSRQLPAQDMAVNASRDMAVAAGQLPDPTLKFGVDNLPVTSNERFSATDDFMTMRKVGVMQEMTRSDKRQLRSERYERLADKSAAEKIVAIASIQRDTAIAWLDRYYAEETVALIAEQATQAREEIQAAESTYRSGHGSQADIFAARSALASVDDRASEAQHRVRNAKIMLARWIGVAADAPLAGKPEVDSIRLDPTSLDTELTHHPQITVLTKQVDIADTEVKLAKANKQTDWSVEVAFQQRGPAYSNMISVGVSIPIQWDQAHRQDRELSAKLATLEQNKAERDEMLREHVAETRTMIEEWQNDRERSERYDNELIPLSADRTQATLAAYRGGKASLIDMLAARRNEIDVRIQALQLQSETARIWAQLNFLIPVGPDETRSDMTMSENKQ